MNDKYLDAEEWTLEDIFKGRYFIPIYQRPYSWTDKEVKQLLADIDESFEIYNSSDDSAPGDSMWLFAGTFFVRTKANIKNSYTEYELVDGQQRITTFTLIFMAILNHLYVIGQEGSEVSEIEKLLWKAPDRRKGKEKELNVLSLGNVDRNIMKSLFDELYAKHDIEDYAKKKLSDEQSKTLNNIEKNLLNNLIIIINHFKKNDDETYFDYCSYIRDNIFFSKIEVMSTLPKLFEIFESINSKGKPLEEVDMIKSYIFQSISENDYDEYLQKWGTLIEATNDNLMDYITVYIRANIKYYRQAISLTNFKCLLSNELKAYYNTDKISNTAMMFINDLNNNVEYYKMLSNVSLLEEFTKSKKLLSIFMMNNIMDYKHTRALFFKLLQLKKNNNLPIDMFEKIAEKTFKFIFTFQSISSRESKQTLTTFVEVQSILYRQLKLYNNTDTIDVNELSRIIHIYNKKICENVITTVFLRERLSLIKYGKKPLVRILLSYLESLLDDGRVDYGKMYSLLKLTADGDLHIDHIIPQNPKKDSKEYYFYITDEQAILKEGQDFRKDCPIDGKSNVMPKDSFFDEYLNVLGNLRLEWANDNIRKSNCSIVIREFGTAFNTYSQITSRLKTIIDQIIDNGILYNGDDIIEIAGEGSQEKTIKIASSDTTIEFKRYNPISYEFLDETYNIGKPNYTALLDSVAKVLYELDAKVFECIANSKLSPMQSSRIFVSTDEKDVRDALTPAPGIYVESNLASDYIIKFIYILVEQFGLSESDLVIQLKEK